MDNGGPLSSNGLFEKRRRRIQQYLELAIDSPDPLQAALGGALADLFDTALQLKHAADQAMAEDADFGRVAPLINMQLNVNRQAARYLAHESQMRDARCTASAPESRRLPKPL